MKRLSVIRSLVRFWCLLVCVGLLGVVLPVVSGVGVVAVGGQEPVDPVEGEEDWLVGGVPESWGVCSIWWSGDFGGFTGWGEFTAF